VRPYKKAFTHEEAVKIIIEGKGSHFDPLLVGVFEQFSDEFGETQEQ
jgi:putative two-component system response regulator